MPDIFGKELHDYSMLSDLAKHGKLDGHTRRLRDRGLIHDFNALPSAHAPRRMPLRDIEANAQALHFVTNNLQAIQAQIENIIYNSFRLDTLFPIITNVPEGAQTYSYKVVNSYGLGKFITNVGKDAGAAGISMQNVPYNLQYGGIIPSWTLEDLRAAAFMGVPLDTETINAGTEGCLAHINSVGLVGDATYGITGLTNNASIASSSASKTIANMTADEMVAFIQTNVTAIIERTKEIAVTQLNSGLTVYLPVAQEALIGDTKLTSDASKTVWEYVSVNNAWTRSTTRPLSLRRVAELDGAGAGATDRALFAFNNDRVMEMAMPIQPRVIRVIDQHYSVDAPMEYKISGLNVKRPGACRYVDGI